MDNSDSSDTSESNTEQSGEGEESRASTPAAPPDPLQVPLNARYPYDMERVLALRIAGVRVRGGEPTLQARRLLGAVAISAAPILLSLLIEWLRPSGSPLLVGYFGWHLYFIGLCILALLFPWVGCRLFYRLSSDLDAALTDEGRATYHKWANLHTAAFPQLIAMVVTALGGVIALYFAQSAPGLESKLFVSPTSYLAAFWTSCLLSNSIYWIASGTILGYRLTRPGRMAPMWSAPARTPGIERLAQCYRQAFYMSSIGTAACMSPLLFWAYGQPDSAVLIGVKVGLLAISMISSFAIAVLPQWWLSFVVLRARQRTLRVLQNALPSTVEEVGDLSANNLAQLVTLIKDVGDSPRTTVSEGTIAALLLAGATGSLPYIVQFVI